MLTTHRGLTKHMNDVLDECFLKIPEKAKDRDLGKIIAYTPNGLAYFKLPINLVMERAVKARRQGAKSRAQAIEWAYDSLLANNAYIRVGEVFRAPLNGTEVFWALVRDRDED